MNKEELLNELSLKVNSGEVSREEVLSSLGGDSVIQSEHKVGKSNLINLFSITKMLYALGAIIATVGVIFFVFQIWEDLGSFGRIIITLGLGLLMTVIGSVLLKSRPNENLGVVFQFIGGLLIPGGALVTLFEFNMLDNISTVAVTFGILFVFYFLLNFVHKNIALTFFTIANGTAFIYLFTEAFIGKQFYNSGDLYAYLTMIMGVSYLLLAQAFRNNWNKELIGILYFFGSIGLLSAAFSQIFDSMIWRMFYLFLVTGGFALAVYYKSRIILVISTLFLIAYVSYITGKYFAESVGWPISLVVLGFVFIGLGYISININKKYIA